MQPVRATGCVQPWAPCCEPWARPWPRPGDVVGSRAAESRLPQQGSVWDASLCCPPSPTCCRGGLAGSSACTKQLPRPHFRLGGMESSRQRRHLGNRNEHNGRRALVRVVLFPFWPPVTLRCCQRLVR